MSDHADFVLPLSALRRGDVGRVGGKNASLGEMIGSLKEAGIGRCQSKIPNTWSGHRTAQIDPKNAGKSMAAKPGSDVLAN